MTDGSEPLMMSKCVSKRDLECHSFSFRRVTRVACIWFFDPTTTNNFPPKFRSFFKSLLISGRAHPRTIASNCPFSKLEVRKLSCLRVILLKLSLLILLFAKACKSLSASILITEFDSKDSTEVK